MTFNSLVFVAFFLVTMALYWNIKGKWRNQLLTVASYVFYAWWDWRLLALLIGITVVGFWVGNAMDAPKSSARRRTLMLGISMAANLGALVVFRHLGFFVDEAGQLLDAIGVGDSPTLDILVPIGVSFYTLQTLGYTIDVYRGRTRAEDHFPTFAAFVSFFPQLVAGPIERAEGLLPQLRRRRRRLQHNDIEDGLALIALGLFKKVVLADGVARVVDAFWTNPDDASIVAAVAGVVGFTVQIYADFSGYSNMARGLARLLGIDLTVNFAQPYLSPDIAGFWRRWHISLGTWLRDYVYIPLGGNQQGRRRTALHIMITMMIGGLWHGASWMFLLWGTVHGVWLVGYHLLARPDASTPSRASTIVRIGLTHLGVTLLWILFRSPDLATAGEVVEALVGRGGSIGDAGDMVLVAGAWMAMIALDVVQRGQFVRSEAIDRKPAAVGIGLGLMIVGVIVFAGLPPVTFLYYQF
ncbi:MAG: MBOAT family protein [Acidimicrobiia bacterium]|nr:MBOAT family protein [Acidimicrobiia bacterium]